MSGTFSRIRDFLWGRKKKKEKTRKKLLSRGSKLLLLEVVPSLILKGKTEWMRWCRKMELANYFDLLPNLCFWFFLLTAIYSGTKAAGTKRGRDKSNSIELETNFDKWTNAFIFNSISLRHCLHQLDYDWAMNFGTWMSADYTIRKECVHMKSWHNSKQLNPSWLIFYFRTAI